MINKDGIWYFHNQIVLVIHNYFFVKVFIVGYFISGL